MQTINDFLLTRQRSDACVCKNIKVLFLDNADDEEISNNQKNKWNFSHVVDTLNTSHICTKLIQQGGLMLLKKKEMRKEMILDH